MLQGTLLLLNENLQCVNFYGLEQAGAWSFFFPSEICVVKHHILMGI